MKSEKTVVFAKKGLEDDYKRLANSEKAEDRKLYSVLDRIRTKVQSEFVTGEEIPKNRIPTVYKRMFHVNNLWKLDISPRETVFYSIVGNEILIVDVVWDFACLADGRALEKMGTEVKSYVYETSHLRVTPLISRPVP